MIMTTNQLKNLLLLALSIILVALLCALGRSEEERRRHSANSEALVAQNNSLRTALSSTNLSLQRLRMTVGELEEFRREDAQLIEQMGIKLRRARSLTLLEGITKLEEEVLTAGRGDTLAAELEGERVALLSDSLSRLVWRDAWVGLDVAVTGRGARLSLEVRDTLFQVVHRVPHRWWIFSWGTKAIRQEIRSSNPHTRLVYAEYIEIEN